MKRHTFFMFWLAVAILLGSLQLFAEHSYSGGDDPDQASQRPGFLMAATEKAPSVPRLSYAHRPTVILFDRDPIKTPIFRSAVEQSHTIRLADLILVTHAMLQTQSGIGTIRSVADPSASIARSFHFDTPIDGGYPIGYVLVDSNGFIRYRTLDPFYAQHGSEFEELLKDIN